MQTTQPTPARIAVVRAIPHPPHRNRWCGLEKWVEDRKVRANPDEKHGLPWPATEIKVAIVEEPAPFDPNANGGAPVEISPATLVMLERDERIAVRVLGGEGGDPADVVRAKAEASKLERELVEARKALSDHSERSRVAQEAHSKQAAEQGAKLAALESELATLRAQLSSRKK